MRIYITWPAGSGKSTLAQQLWEYYSIPVTHLDTLLWNRDWTENPRYKELQEEVIQGSSWIIEWSSCSIIKSMYEVDRIIILDTGYLGNIWRILKRTIIHMLWKEKRIGINIPERWNTSLLIKSITWRKKQLPRIIENIRLQNLHNKVIYIHSCTHSFEQAKTIIKSNG